MICGSRLKEKKTIAITGTDHSCYVFVGIQTLKLDAHIGIILQF